MHFTRWVSQLGGWDSIVLLFYLLNHCSQKNNSDSVFVFSKILHLSIKYYIKLIAHVKKKILVLSTTHLKIICDSNFFFF